MIQQTYVDMLGKKNVIRTLAEFAAVRGQEIGYENVFDYSLGNPSIPVPQQFTDTMIRMLQEKDPVALHSYSPTVGIASYKKAIADSLRNRFGVPYEAEHIYPTAAACGAIAHALRLISGPGDEILTFAPYFSEYTPYVTLTGASLKAVPADTESFQINFEAFREMLNERVAAVMINTPNNPSGAVYSAETLTKLAETLREFNEKFGHTIYLISDEPYREIVYDGKQAPYVASFYENTLTCYSFSKALSLPGERIGYLAIHPECDGDAAKMVMMCGQISRGIGHLGPNSILQLAVQEMPDLTVDMSVYEANRNLLYNELTALGFEVVKPEGTFYIFPKALEEDSVAFCQKATKYDLILVPGDGFDCKGWFRMAYCIDTEKVERSLPALREFVSKEYGRG